MGGHRRRGRDHPAGRGGRAGPDRGRAGVHRGAEWEGSRAVDGATLRDDGEEILRREPANGAELEAPHDTNAPAGGHRPCADEERTQTHHRLWRRQGQGFHPIRAVIGGEGRDARGTQRRRCRLRGVSRRRSRQSAGGDREGRGRIPDVHHPRSQGRPRGIPRITASVR